MPTAPNSTDKTIVGKEGIGNVASEANKILGSGMKVMYQSKEFTLNNGSSDVDFAATQNAFENHADPDSKMPRAHAVLIRSDQPIEVKFNSTAKDSITIEANVPFPYSALEMTNLFLSNNSGSNASVKVILG